MEFFTDWLAVLVVGFFAVSAPGPDFAITLRNSLVFSRRAGIMTALGIAAGLNFHIAYSVVGIGLIISKSLLLFNVIKWIGAAYLVYVGVRSLLAKKNQAQDETEAAPAELSGAAAFWMGFLTNVLNPKVALFFLALFTQVIRTETPPVVQALFGFTVLGEALIWFPLVALLVSHHEVRRRLITVTHWIERAFGVVFVALGLRLAFVQMGK